MTPNNYHRLRAFYKTASLWNGPLAGVLQFPLSEFDLSHLKEKNPYLKLPEIPENTILGKRAEYLYQWCIEQSLNYKLIAANVQINVPGKTIGELDYLIKELKTGRIFHIELVYKFYCYDPNSSQKSVHLDHSQHIELSKYIGPNKRDNFVYKLDRLINHQLPLLYHPATRVQLAPLELDIDQIEQRACFLAHIFIPRDMWQHDFKYINKRSIAGYYMNKDAFAKAYSTHLYYFPHKRQWIMPAHCLTVAYSHENALLLVMSSLDRNFAPLLWMQLEDGNFEKFFVIN